MAAFSPIDPLDLRLRLINDGVRLGSIVEAMGMGSLEGLDLILPDGEQSLWVNVPTSPSYADTSPWQLIADEDDISRRQRRDGWWVWDGLRLKHEDGTEVAAAIPDTSAYRHGRTPDGCACADVGALHGEWFVCAPLAVRDALGLDQPRRFLGVPPHRPQQKGQWSTEDIVEAFATARRQTGVRRVHLEAGHVLRDDAGVSVLEPIISAIKRSASTLVSVTILPPEDPQALLGLYAAGADAVAMHALTWDPSVHGRIAPERQRLIGHQRILGSLDAAAQIFPSGAVSSDLIVGLEPIDSLRQGLDRLAARGVVPNLSCYRPLGSAAAGDLIDTATMSALMRERLQILQRYGLDGSLVQGFPRRLVGGAYWRPGMRNRLYAWLRRRWRLVTDTMEEPLA